MKHTFQSRILPLYLGLIVAAVLSVTLYSANAFDSFFRAQKERELTETASLLAALVPRELLAPGAGASGADAFAGTAGVASSARITVVLPDGTVAGDSDEDPAVMENHAERPEIAQALRGERGVSVRHSGTLGTGMLYVAVPVVSEGRVVGVLRASAQTAGIGAALRGLYLRSAVSGAFVMLAAGLVGFLLVRRIAKPISALHAAAERYARGELEFRVSIDRPGELRSLAETLNDMAGQLRRRIQTVTSQRNELDGILSSMSEAVFLLDGALQVRRMNTAARRLFGKSAEPVAGRPLLEICRNTDLQSFAERTLESGGPLEESLTVYGTPPVHLQAHGTVLAGESGPNEGVLLVLADVSRLVRLEGVRRDFVANVSHELRTPVTSIMGFIETLREGAADDPGTRERFLSIIGRHAERLQAIMDDLLTLARLEQGGREAVRMEPCRVEALVHEVLELCGPAAEAKEISIVTSVPDEPLEVRANAVLLEQAVMNLVDNAIKYSEPGTAVEVSVKPADGTLEIAVRDRGCGIPARDLPRIFERFYRVDKARSRTLGGTGLGLAIVKHIALVHRGEATVESVLGEGSTFTIRLPM